MAACNSSSKRKSLSSRTLTLPPRSKEEYE
uniref:Uncharacterized protein n=1 Tax=Nelumbo nucifera TaxID=4432 RepID=A0A822Y9W0_NELNU|nr:TPA_asm: hypothetical protein HUJ06_009715 [Nelumbo nucifera]